MTLQNWSNPLKDPELPGRFSRLIIKYMIRLRLSEDQLVARFSGGHDEPRRSPTSIRRHKDGTGGQPTTQTIGAYQKALDIPDTEIDTLPYPGAEPSPGLPGAREYRDQFQQLVAELNRLSNSPYEVQRDRAAANAALAEEDFGKARRFLTAAADATRRTAEQASEEYARSLAALGALAFTELDFAEARVRYGMAMVLPGLAEDRLARYRRSYLIASSAVIARSATLAQGRTVLDEMIAAGVKPDAVGLTTLVHKAPSFEFGCDLAKYARDSRDWYTIPLGPCYLVTRRRTTGTIIRKLPVTTQEHIGSLLVRLQHASAHELDDTLQALLGYPEALDRVVAIVNSKIDAGSYFTNQSLASLVSQTRASQLYAKVRGQLLEDRWTLVTLYESQYPDPEIEKNLCDRLYKIASDDSAPLRRNILDAMRKVGSEAVLPTLEAILFDLEPIAKVRKAFAGALGVLGNLEARSRIEFVRSLALAIEDIKNRVTSTSETVNLGAPEIEIADRAGAHNNASHARREQARKFIDAGDPVVAVMMMRIGAEALAKDLYRRLGLEQNSKPARKMCLDELLKSVKDSDAPEVFKLLVQTFQVFGNFATHDQDRQSEYLTKEIASALLALFDQALSIYAAWSVEGS